MFYLILNLVVIKETVEVQIMNFRFFHYLSLQINSPDIAFHCDNATMLILAVDDCYSVHTNVRLT